MSKADFQELYIRRKVRAFGEKRAKAERETKRAEDADEAEAKRLMCEEAEADSYLEEFIDNFYQASPHMKHRLLEMLRDETKNMENTEND